MGAISFISQNFLHFPPEPPKKPMVATFFARASLSTLIKVDGFDSPYEFESFVRETNKKANLLLQQNNPERFKYKYGADADEKSLIKQS